MGLAVYTGTVVIVYSVTTISLLPAAAGVFIVLIIVPHGVYVRRQRKRLANR